MAPEYATTGHYSMKLDIFSSSVIILEIVSGQRNNLFEPDLEVENLLNYVSSNLWSIICYFPHANLPHKLFFTFKLGDFGMKELL